MQALGCGLPGWQRAVQRLQADRKQMKQRLTAYSTEVAQSYALSLLPQLLISNGWLHAHRCAPSAGCRRCGAHSQHQPLLSQDAHVASSPAAIPVGCCVSMVDNVAYQTGSCVASLIRVSAYRHGA